MPVRSCCAVAGRTCRFTAAARSANITANAPAVTSRGGLGCVIGDYRRDCSPQVFGAAISPIITVNAAAVTSRDGSGLRCRQSLARSNGTPVQATNGSPGRAEDETLPALKRRPESPSQGGPIRNCRRHVRSAAESPYSTWWIDRSRSGPTESIPRLRAPREPERRRPRERGR
jgi:hypothetical protein